LYGIYSSRSQLEQFLHTLNAYKNDIPNAHACEFITGLMHIVDSLPRGYFLEFDAASSAMNTAYWYLLHLTTADRYNAIEYAANLSDGTHLLGSLIYYAERTIEEDFEDKKLVTDDELSKLKTLFRTKVLARLDSDPISFFSNSSAKSDLYSLSRVSEPGLYLDLIDSFAKSHILMLLNVMKNETHTVDSVSFKFESDTLLKFLSIETLTSCLAKLDLTSLNSDELELLREANEMIARFNKGEPDDNF